MKKAYNYFYKITNNINNHFYYGVHCTDNLNDGYMGSGKRLHYAYKKYNIENFSKEILYFFDTIQEAYEYEAEVVNETLILDPNCYNIKQGGQGWNTYGLATVKDKDGNCFDVPVDDPRIKSGELVGATKGMYTYIDKDNNRYYLDKNDRKIKELHLKPYTSFVNTICVKDKNDNIFLVNNTDSNYISGKLVPVNRDKVLVKDKYNNYYEVYKTDKRYISGELKPIWTGWKHKPETIEKAKQTYKEHKHQQGEKNSQFGTCWVYKLDENNKPINIKIKKEEIDNYIKEGWIKGRKIKGS